VTWQNEIETYLEWLVASDAPRESITVRRSYLSRLATEFPDDPFAISPDQLINFLGVGHLHWKPETRKSARSAVRSFYSWAASSGRIGIDPAANLPGVRVPRKAPRPTPPPVVRNGLAVADRRGRVMIRLAVEAGLRRAEVARAHSSHIIRDLLGYTLHVIGKGKRERDIPLQHDFAHVLLSLGPGFFFPGSVDGHLSPNHVGRLLSTYLGPGWSGHTLRHRFATDAFAVDRNLPAVQELLGHENINTTMIYTFVPPDHLRSTVDGIQPWAA
jgi:site-specific recombinase XerC